MSVWKGPLLGFDTETTGRDPFEARVVSFALVESMKPFAPMRVGTSIVNPGVEIPDEVTQIHGISTQMAREAGIPPNKAVEHMLTVLREFGRQSIPVVVYNANYDLTLLNEEAKRYGLEPLAPDFGPVIDPFVIDRFLDKYRPGSRKLVDVCSVYGVTLSDAHNAAADAEGSIKLARRFGRSPGADAITDPGDLHQLQIEWQEAQRVDFNRYLLSKGADRERELNPPGWPFYRKEA